MLIRDTIQLMSGMNDITDYKEFTALCHKSGIVASRAIDYAQLVGILIVGRKMFPNVSDLELFDVLHTYDRPNAKGISFSSRPLSTEVAVTKLAKAITGWVKAGLPFRNPEELKRILDICQACDKAEKIRFGLIRCSAVKGGCGCVVNAKGRMETETCPMGKW